MTRKEVEDYVKELFFNNEIDYYWELEDFVNDYAFSGIDEALDRIGCSEVMEEIYGIFEDIPYDENLDDEDFIKESVKKIENVFDNFTVKNISKAIRETITDWNVQEFEEQYMRTHEL